MTYLIRYADYIAAVLVSLVAVIALVVSSGFPSTPIPTDIGAGAFPRAFACILLFLCACLAGGRFFFGPSSSAEEQEEGETKTTAKGLIRPALGVAAMTLYIAGLSAFGYLAMTVPFLIFMIWLMGFRNLFWNIVISVALTAGLYFLFKVGLQVPLPDGDLFY